MYQQNIPMTKVPIKAESATDGPSVVFLRHVRQCRFRDVLSIMVRVRVPGICCDKWETNLDFSSLCHVVHKLRIKPLTRFYLLRNAF